VSGHAKMPPASHQVSATSLKLLIQQTHPHVRVERDSGMYVEYLVQLAPRGAWLRRKSCQEISSSRPGDIKEVSFAWLFK
jgi:hypothetical protein